MINPEVAKADKSMHYVAIILDDLRKLGIPCQRKVIDKAIRDGSCGNTCDSRYFLKEGSTACSIQGQPKSTLRKARCCTISKAVLNPETLRRLDQGTNALCSHQNRGREVFLVHY